MLQSLALRVGRPPVCHVDELARRIHGRCVWSNVPGEWRTRNCCQGSVRTDSVCRDVVADSVRHEDKPAHGIHRQSVGIAPCSERRLRDGRQGSIGINRVCRAWSRLTVSLLLTRTGGLACFKLFCSTFFTFDNVDPRNHNEAGSEFAR